MCAVVCAPVCTEARLSSKAHDGWQEEVTCVLGNPVLLAHCSHTSCNIPANSCYSSASALPMPSWLCLHNYQPFAASLPLRQGKSSPLSLMNGWIRGQWDQ